MSGANQCESSARPQLERRDHRILDSPLRALEPLRLGLGSHGRVRRRYSAFQVSANRVDFSSSKFQPDWREITERKVNCEVKAFERAAAWKWMAQQVPLPSLLLIIMKQTTYRRAIISCIVCAKRSLLLYDQKERRINYMSETDTTSTGWTRPSGNRAGT